MNVETFFGPFASCEDLIAIYTPRLKATPDDPALLRKIVNLFSKKGCNDAPIYMEAAEKLHKTEPSAKSALSLARMYDAKGQTAKATTYFNEAVELESDVDKKANLLIELSDLYMRNLKNYSQARTYAQRAASIKPNWGRPWMMIGDIYFSSSLLAKTNLMVHLRSGLLLINTQKQNQLMEPLRMKQTKKLLLPLSTSLTRRYFLPRHKSWRLLHSEMLDW